MDWFEYKKFLEQKIADAKYNLDHAAKEYWEAKTKYEIAVREKENFEKTLAGDRNWNNSN